MKNPKIGVIYPILPMNGIGTINPFRLHFVPGTGTLEQPPGSS